MHFACIIASLDFSYDSDRVESLNTCKKEKPTHGEAIG